jgi:hypothetical protein
MSEKSSKGIKGRGITMQPGLRCFALDRSAWRCPVAMKKPGAEIAPAVIFRYFFVFQP